MDLARIFPKPTEAAWRELVDGVLKGVDFEKRLVSRTLEGIAIQPLYPRRTDAEPIAGLRGAARWRTTVRFDDPDAGRGNSMLLDELEGGADSIALTFAGSPNARGFGLREASQDALSVALRDVHCDLISVRLESAPFDGRAAANAFVAFARHHRLPGATLDVDFGLEPLADIAATGSCPLPFATFMGNVREIVGQLQDGGYRGPYIRCDGRVFHEAGAGEAQELAAIIAQGAAYLRALDAGGVVPDEVRGWLSFTLSADDDQFLTIAKCRALRRLWARIEEACDLPPVSIRLHAETSWRMLSRHDAHVNILRSTIAAFSAGVGGADSLCVIPHSAVLGLPDAAARRLARNTSLILAAEANIPRVIDPAAGSGAIETLTDELAYTAWGIFQNIEAQRAGNETGLAAALTNGFFVGEITKVRKKREAQVATRRQPLTGVSEFPNLAEASVEVLVPRALEKADAPFASHRLAMPYEALRERAEALAAAGRPVRVFLANLGRIPDFGARAMFAKNAFEAGGIGAFGNDGFATTFSSEVGTGSREENASNKETEGDGTDLVAMTDAFKASGATLACICSSDAIYAEEALDAATVLVASGAEAVFLAGQPGEAENAYRTAGISGFLVARMDLPAFLAPLLEG